MLKIHTEQGHNNNNNYNFDRLIDLNHSKSIQSTQELKLSSLMGATLCANNYPTSYIYCIEVHLSFCNYVNDNFETAGEWTFTLG